MQPSSEISLRASPSARSPPPDSADSPVSPLPFFFFLAKTDCNIRVLSSRFPYDGGSGKANRLTSCKHIYYPRPRQILLLSPPPPQFFQGKRGI